MCIRDRADAEAAENGDITMDELAAKVIPADVDLSPLTHESELALMRKMDDFGPLVTLAARDRAAFRLTHYAQDLAALFHSFYTNCHVTVSYTHLDVYKRQGMMMTGGNKTVA